MPDFLTPAQRSARMARVRSKNTKPELRVRGIAYAMGYRFRLHRRDLPGTPDLAFPGRRKVVFVHGCFWHGHPSCRRASMPETHRGFWADKILGNRQRDERNAAFLEAAGWAILVLWECELRDADQLGSRLANFLGPPGSPRRPAGTTTRQEREGLS